MTTPKKAATHERIVEHAARSFRRAGYDGVSVADIMKEAGLTHGGFYAHFDSRDDLVVEALEHAAAQSLAQLSSAVEAAEKEGKAERRGLDVVAERYLSDAHLEHPELGCSLAALGSETPRQSPAVRALASRHAKAFAALVERLLPERAAGDEREARRDEARWIVSALVGSMVISRAVDNPETSKGFRGAVKRFIHARAGKAPRDRKTAR
jgi:TetR/AcrR family transcriptional regulator, transcriptional repressor for nem operon